MNDILNNFISHKKQLRTVFAFDVLMPTRRLSSLSDVRTIVINIFGPIVICHSSTAKKSVIDVHC